MTDIVERLRELADRADVIFDPSFSWPWRQAADEIERLRTENQELKLQYLSDQGQWIEETGRLREALRWIADNPFDGDNPAHLMRLTARTALEQAQPVAAREEETV